MKTAITAAMNRVIEEVGADVDEFTHRASRLVCDMLAADSAEGDIEELFAIQAEALQDGASIEEEGGS
ncbi:MAG TPA: hypothetical protein VGS07_08010 [Thermoanaerobaculia bacterium]|jgi:hypothetical protein|nr:hypothetical protein [Thermoanaerobaculia bacterium]